ncbi:uncharacterized protein K02A2.6-like [Anopheles marshallii]|uniref:uncharacterized protein K02A2.6-like n=1 Tax=Anopheles marshallii TaxID=1521116 RepID=UPI00237B5FF9|nr:uncharacterized protein K02A2.6-like [Anopheles marshallii]
MNNDGETRQQVQSVQNGGQRGSVPESDSGTGWIHELFKQQHAMMQEQQQAFMKQQEKLIAEIWQTARLREPVNVEQIGDVLAGQIKDFKFNPDERVTFEGWFSRYEDLFEKDAKKLDDDAKVRLLLRKLGLAEHERYVSHVLPSKPKDFNFEETVEKLKALFGSRESEVSKRYKCLQLRKEKTEDYVVFSCRVNKSVVEAKLAGLSEEQLKCLIYVCGLQDDSDSEIRLRLLSRIEDRRISTLDQLVEECQRLVSLKKDTAMFEKVPHQVNVVNDGKIERFAPKRRSFVKSTAATTKGKLKCCLCGEEHYARKCKYGGYRCNKCHRYGHKEGFCDSAARYASQTKNARIKTVIVNTLGDRQKRHVNVVVNDVPMEFMIDTGADITIISMKEWQRIGSPGLIPASIKAKTASGEQLKIVGEFRAEMKLQQQCKQCIVRVTNEKLMLLGQDAMDVFGLWNIPLSAVCNRVSSQDQFAEFNDIFSNEMGCCKRSKVKLVLKEGAVPVFRPKRPVAYAMLEAVDRELDRLEKEGIISRVDFSAWAAPIVVVRKANGTIRICGDYSTGLNDALQSHHYPIPLPDDIFASLSKSTVFSQIDLSDAFLQVEVEDSSREYLTVNTHRGLYVYNRLPPGVKAAPSAFQQLMETMLTGLKDVAAYLDDIVVGGVDEATHLDNLYAVFRRLRDYGFRIRREKCSFQQKQIKYLGHILDRDGLRPDPAKIDVIVKMPPPKQTSEVRSFLGAVNYYGKFVPQMRNLRYPLDELLKKDGSWQWNSECQRAFDMFKQILRSDLLLTHYDPTKEIIVAADASSVGVGATISHRMSDGSLKVVQHAARALTKAEVNYSQPDREGLAVIYAITKFHRMIFGRKFTLHTDHAPLIRIFGSRTGIPVYTANRLQRWALTLLLYDFKIEYVPTDKFGNADILSRLIAKHERPDEDYVIASIKLEKDMNAMVMQVTGAMPLKFDDVVKATRSDPVLSRVFFYIQEGWPHDKLNDAELRNFQSRSESLSTLRGGIFFVCCKQLFDLNIQYYFR